jgi:hypothetical protein
MDERPTGKPSDIIQLPFPDIFLPVAEIPVTGTGERHPWSGAPKKFSRQFRCEERFGNHSSRDPLSMRKDM